MSLADTLQASLLPRAIPAVRGIDVGAEYHPGSDVSMVGGDFYDVFEHQDGQVLVAVGDVVGKGPRAAALTGLARYTIRSAALRGSNPGDILRTVAEAFVVYEPDEYCTILLAAVGPYPRREVTIATGGHHLPLLLKDEGPVATIGTFGRMLGFIPDPSIGEEVVALDRGDTVVMFTDGVVDAQRSNERYGEARIVATVGGSAGQDAKAIASRLAGSALEYGADSARDDIVVVACKVTD